MSHIFFLFLKLSGTRIAKKNYELDGTSYFHQTKGNPLKYLTFGQCLKNAAEKYPNRQAVVSCTENSSITFAKALHKVKL